MQSLYKKSEIGFAILWIMIYVVGTGIADNISKTIGIAKSLTFVLYIALSLTAFFWIKKNNLLEKYGICKTKFSPSKYLFYIPLIILSSVNFWFGVKINMPIYETVFYVGSMICVGFLEEIIFRGFLFKAMAKDNVKSAIILSSLTFGIGHIVNLINGTTDIISNVCQIFYAIAFGYMFVIIFHRGKSLVPCIVTHSAVNSFSAFANETSRNNTINITVSVVICIIALTYSFILQNTLKKQT